MFDSQYCYKIIGEQMIDVVGWFAIGVVVGMAASCVFCMFLVWLFTKGSK